MNMVVESLPLDHVELSHVLDYTRKGWCPRTGEGLWLINVSGTKASGVVPPTLRVGFLRGVIILPNVISSTKLLKFREVSSVELSLMTVQEHLTWNTNTSNYLIPTGGD